MKRLFSVAAAAALLVALLPIGAVAAHDKDKHDNGNGNGHPGKVTICHNPNGAHPVKITVSKSSWTARAHMKHGDFIVTAQTPCVPKPKPPKPTAETCTFAGTANYSGTNGVSTGPITFKYSKPTMTTAGVVESGGTWNETFNSVLYANVITGGTVPYSGSVVNLRFSRPIGTPVYEFNGSLSSNNLNGSLTNGIAGNSFVTTGGSVTCVSTAPQVCTFVGTAQYVRVPPVTGVSTGPLQFSWATATGIVSSGSWDELYLGVHYPTTITGGMIGSGTATLTFLYPPSFNYTFAGTFTKPATGPWTLSGTLTGSQPAGNQFTASGNVTCNGTQSHGGHDNEDDD